MAIASVRPTQHRLAIAMLLASAAVCAVLWLVALWLESRRAAQQLPAGPVTLTVERQTDAPAESGRAAADPEPAPAVVEPVKPPSPDPVEETHRPASPADANPSATVLTDEGSAPAETPLGAAVDAVVVDSPPPACRDWNAIAAAGIATTLDEREAAEEVLAAQWNQSRSIMFRPEDEWIIGEEPSIIERPDFKPHVGVLGVGVTIGSCFFGLPLIGVPLDKRATSGFTLVVCKETE